MSNKLVFGLTYSLLIVLNIVLWKFDDFASPTLIMSARILILSVLAYFTIRKKSLTLWIMFAMVAGVEMGVEIWV